MTPLDLVLSKLGNQAKKRGDYYQAHCPAHQDDKPSLTISTGDDNRVLLHCHTGCTPEAVVAALGLNMSDLFSRNGTEKPQASRIEKVYDYRAANGDLLYQTVRYIPKDFRQRRPDGNGGWIWNLDGTERVLYRLPELLAADPGRWVFIPEGEKDVDNLIRLDLIATTNVTGAGKWRESYSEVLRGRRVCVLPDNDAPGKDHAQAVASSLADIAADVRILELPNLPPKGDVSDWLTAGGDAVILVQLAESVQRPGPCSLADVKKTFSDWLFLPDMGSLYVILASIIANRFQGDPVWTLIIGPPGSGKTEELQSTLKLPNMYPCATLTESSLLSGSSKRDKAPDAKGGLLRAIGDFGIILVKDFGSILSLNRDNRSAILQALREVYDGSWTRHVGTDGGRTLSWSGKVGLVGGATPAIDSHHTVMSILGERFIFYRLPPIEERGHAQGALKHLGQEEAMRHALSEVVCGLFAGLTIPDTLPELDAAERDWLIDLARFTARCRSGVLRDPYTREVDQVVGVEAPTRLVLVFARLLTALKVLGIPDIEAYSIIQKVSLDSLPQLRRRVIEELANLDKSAWLETPEVAAAVSHPTQTTRRALEDLTCYTVIERVPGHTDEWRLTDLGRELYLNVLNT